MLTKPFEALRAYNRAKGTGGVTPKELKTLVDCTISKDNLRRGAKTLLKQMNFDGTKEIPVGELSFIGFTEEFLTFKKQPVELFNFDGISGTLALEMAKDEQQTEPTTILGTIHSIKGGECDHVHLDTSTTRRCLRGAAQDSEIEKEEKRVAFVAVTRARKTLRLLHQKGVYNKILPRI